MFTVRDRPGVVRTYLLFSVSSTTMETRISARTNVVARPVGLHLDLRPIPLTATLGKVLESLVGSWILQTVESNLDGCQYGGLKRRSTTHALIDMLHHWHDVVDKGQSVHAVFVDFAKAFDHVDHNILVTKLLRFGLSDTVMCWMCDFLRHRTHSA